MDYIKPDFDSDLKNDQVEYVDNKVLLWLQNFWKFSLFYGSYLSNLHCRRKTKR